MPCGEVRYSRHKEKVIKILHVAFPTYVWTDVLQPLPNKCALLCKGDEKELVVQNGDAAKRRSDDRLRLDLLPQALSKLL